MRPVDLSWCPFLFVVPYLTVLWVAVPTTNGTCWRKNTAHMCDSWVKSVSQESRISLARPWSHVHHQLVSQQEGGYLRTLKGVGGRNLNLFLQGLGANPRHSMGLEWTSFRPQVNHPWPHRVSQRPNNAK